MGQRAIRFGSRLRMGVSGVILLSLLYGPAAAQSETSTSLTSAGLAATECEGLTPTMSGTAGNDRLLGTAGADVIFGLEGNDQIAGLGGDDVICGGPGGDWISGGAGADSLFGDDGDDRLFGDVGNDLLSGGPGVDRLAGDAGDDQLLGDPTDFGLHGGPDYDLCYSGPDNPRQVECEEALDLTLQWRPPTFGVSALPGSVIDAVIRFTYSGPDIGAPTVEVSGPAASSLVVDVAGMRPTGDGDYELPVVVTVPANAAGDLSGALVLRDGTRRVGPTLPIHIDVTAPSDIPRTPARPSPDRIGETTDGVLVVIDEVVLGVDLDEADPDSVAQNAALATGARIIGSAPGLNLYQLQYPGSSLAETEARIPTLEAISGVEFASLNVVDRDEEETIPDDSEWDSWDTSNPGGNNWGLEWIDAPSAWDKTTGSSSVRIGVIDTDNDEDHSDLDDNVVNTSRGARAEGHGTHVAGTICAEGDNDKGITGVMWDCELRFYAYGRDAVTTADAMRRAADDRNRVVNMSLQFIDNNRSVPITPALIQLAEDTNDIFGRAVVYGQRTADVLWVFAAGNETGRDVRFTAPGGLTARFPTNTMAVAAIDRDGNLAGFSNTGDLVSVAAPGVDIYSTLPRTGCWIFTLGCDDAYGEKDGTSMAAPHVTGLAGLVVSEDPSRTASEVKACIVGAALSDGEAVPGHPFSVIDAPAAVDCTGTIDLPEKVDVVLAFDLTGSMGSVLDQAKEQMQRAIEAVRSAASGSDIRYSVVSYEDYPGFFDSRPCGSSYAATYGSSSDAPFRVNSASTNEDSTTTAAIDALRLGRGADGPESYGRALWEIAQPDTAATLGLRADALTLIVNFADNVPHDTNLNEGVEGASGVFDTGVDPGRNGVVDCRGDDIDFQDDALGNLRDANIRLLHVDSSGGSYEAHWRTWASATGGGYTRLDGDRTLSEVILELLALI